MFSKALNAKAGDRMASQRAAIGSRGGSLFTKALLQTTMVRRLR